MERDAINERLERAQMELKMIEQQEGEEMEVLRRLNEEEQQVDEQISLISNLLDPLTQEKTKLRVLVESMAPQLLYQLQ